MLSSVWQDIKREISFGNNVSRLIVVNVLVFLAVVLLKLILYLVYMGTVPGFYHSIVRYLSLSPNWFFNLTHPWVIVTHMFFHEGLFHILWNMLILYWFGQIVGDLLGNNRIVPLYLLGGLGGALFFVLYAQIVGMGSWNYAYGASAAALAMAMAAATIAPDYIFRLVFLGDVRLKYIVLFLIVIDLIGVTGSTNVGGHFAHLGGIFTGWFFVFQLRRGVDISIPFTRLFDRMRKWTKVSGTREARHKYVRDRPENMAWRRQMNIVKGGKSKPGSSMDIDLILDKIKQKGIDSLTQEELDFLNDVSNK